MDYTPKTMQTVTCPRCKEVLPNIFPSDPAPGRGDLLECGMCSHVWRFRMAADDPSDPGQTASEVRSDGRD